MIIIGRAGLDRRTRGVADHHLDRDDLEIVDG
jgi:hypothetical protein